MPEPLNYNGAVRLYGAWMFSDAYMLTQGDGGQFIVPWARVGKCRQEAYDNTIGNRLWAWLTEQTTLN